VSILPGRRDLIRARIMEVAEDMER